MVRHRPDPVLQGVSSFEFGDVLIAVDGRSVGSRAEALDALDTSPTEHGRHTVVIDRAGEHITLEFETER